MVSTIGGFVPLLIVFFPPFFLGGEVRVLPILHNLNLAFADRLFISFFDWNVLPSASF